MPLRSLSGNRQMADGPLIRSPEGRTGRLPVGPPASSIAAFIMGGIMGGDLRAEIRGFEPLDSTRSAPCMGKSRLFGVRGSYSRAKWNYSKITINNNMLRGKLDHDCVLFVQHPSEKGRGQGVPSGSFVACAGVLGNCDRATEGGIPRSSR
jgi:hypothetical protein